MYSSAIDPFVHFILQEDPRYYYFASIFCWRPNCLSYQINVNKYEVKHFLYNPEYEKKVFKYSTKCLIINDYIEHETVIPRLLSRNKSNV